MDEWVRTDRTERDRTDRPRRSSGRTPASTAPRPQGPPSPERGPTALPADVATEIRRAADGATARHREVLVDRMAGAVAAYDRHRFQESLRVAKQLAHEIPGVAAIRRLAGFSAYRLGRWREAAGHLQAYGDLSGEVDAVPALMDCLRALGRSKAVATLWTELRQRSPDADLLAEARMVAAGSLADRGDLDGAVALLGSAGAGKALRNPSERHLRQWYALGDLYERAGDLPRARELFTRVANVDPEAYDVAERLDALGRARRGAGRAGGAAGAARRRPPKPEPRTRGRAETDAEAAATTGADRADTDRADTDESPGAPEPLTAPDGADQPGTAG